MKKPHVTLEFKRFSIPFKVDRGRIVVAQLTGSLVFKNLPVSMEDLAAKTEELFTRSLATVNGGKEATALMHQTEKEWNDMMYKTALYVDLTANGDAALILGAGFDLEKQPDPAVRPVFKAELGSKSGSVILRRQALPGAKAYIMQLYMGETAPTNEKDWIQIQVISKASLELSGLLTLTKYWFRVAVVTAEGTTDFCQPVSLVVI
jgi:hypothetical protein